MNEQVNRQASLGRSAPLADVLLGAARAVQAVLAGVSLTEAVARTPVAMRPAVQAVSFHAMRQLGRARAVKESLITRAPSDPLLDALLLVSFSLLVPGDSAEHTAGGEGAMYAPHTVVDQAVRAVDSQRSLLSYKGLVNGSLRRFLREQASIMASLEEHAEARWNHPTWWQRRLRADYPDTWQELLRAANAPAPMVLRVNRRRATREQVLEAFAAAGILAEPVGQDGLALAAARPVQQLPGFDTGWWSVQDAGAQLAAPLLAVTDGMRVLDACAAPGGKTAHLLELADLDLLAVDVDAARLMRVDENLARLGLQARTLAADVQDLDSWWDGVPFDAVLADVPCTASGIVRRHPDIRWLRREPDIVRTARLQASLADALWRVVAPGGKLLYVTCSIFPAEGSRQADAFLSRHKDAVRLPAPGQLLPSRPGAAAAEQHDGFFYALFTKV